MRGEEMAEPKVLAPEEIDALLSASDPDEGDEALSGPETAAGVRIGRVEMHVAGSRRMVPQKIMPDPEQPERFVLMTRHQHTGELVPQKRRGEKRVVARDADGIWREEGVNGLSAAMEEAMAEDAAGATEDREGAADALAGTMEANLRGELLFGGRDGPVSARESECRITSYDFKHPARINKDQLRVLQNLHDQFARLLSRSLSGHMQQVVDVDTAFVDQTTYGEFIMSLSNPCLSYAFTLGDAGRAIFDIAMPVVCAIVDRAMGGTGSAKGVQARQVTPIEIGQMNLVAKRVIQDLEATWQPITPSPISEVELETNPEFVQLTAASEIVILLAFEVNTSQVSGLVSLCYPFFTLEPLLYLFGCRDPERTARHNKEERRLANRLRLGDMDVELVAELGRTRFTAGEAAELAAGDVICLQARSSAPARVFLGGRPVFLAWPLEEGGEVKLKIAGRIPPHLAEKYGTVPSG